MKSENKIAVIGMSCRFPGAGNVQEFWDNLVAGKETIKHFTDDELRPFEIDYDKLKENTSFVAARGVLDDVDKFDANFFGYTPGEAAMMDPQHRIWLESVWEAFENAACDPLSYKGAIGVYAGGYINTYLLNNVLRDPVKLENYIRLRTTESFQILTSNEISYLPTKTAYKFNLKGPAINVQTACSTSLVAITQACNSLAKKESDVCIAGGVCIVTPQESGYLYQEGAIPSPDGHCRPFDAKSQGTVFSNGVGVVVLKRLDDAVQDKDNIIAVVDGWAINNDGNKKVSYTAPSIDGQSAVISAAQKHAGVSPEDLSYIEAHGTATLMGDPIEITALTQSFSEKTEKKQFCGIGSVKSNIGHTDAAAGAASFIKLCLIAKNKCIPPSLNYETPNPYINFKNTPFYVVDKTKHLDTDKKVILGVSAFGIGGTNAHIIIEEPPKTKAKEASELSDVYTLPLSAKSESSLEMRAAQLKELLTKTPNIDLDDLAYTLWHGKQHMSHRAYHIVSKNNKTLHSEFKLIATTVDLNASALCFLFPGQGAQYHQMAKELYNENHGFKSILDEGFEILSSESGVNIKEVLFDSNDQEKSDTILSQTAITQAVLYIIEYALAKTLIDRNISPGYLIGHSIGEYAAASISGVFDFNTGLKIVIKRGQLMQSMPAGQMYAVRSNIDDLNAIKESLFEVATENASNSFTISFNSDDTDAVNKLLDAHDIRYIPLKTSHGFHSKAFDPILDSFAEYVDQFTMNAPTIPVISCLTGDFLTPQQASSGKYWANQLRNTVRFHSGIKSIVSNEDVVFIEVGPHEHLGSILRSISEVENKKSILSTLGRPESKVKTHIIENIEAMLWATFNMYSPILSFIAKDAKKIQVPGYPFDKQRHWIDYTPQSTPNTEHKELINKDLDIADKCTIDVLSEIWKELIGLKDIKPTDNFFYIGGNSLLAISIVDAAKKKFNFDLKLRVFFDAPTIYDFAKYIDTLKYAVPENQVISYVGEVEMVSGEL